MSNIMLGITFIVTTKVGDETVDDVSGESSPSRAGCHLTAAMGSPAYSLTSFPPSNCRSAVSVSSQPHCSLIVVGPGQSVICLHLVARSCVPLLDVDFTREHRLQVGSVKVGVFDRISEDVTNELAPTVVAFLRPGVVDIFEKRLSHPDINRGFVGRIGFCHTIVLNLYGNNRYDPSRTPPVKQVGGPATDVELSGDPEGFELFFGVFGPEFLQIRLRTYATRC